MSYDDRGRSHPERRPPRHVLRRTIRGAGAWLLAAACASQPARPPQNVASTAGARVTLTPDQALGWIGVAPELTHTPGEWIPSAGQVVLVPMPAEGLVAGAALSVIDTKGRTTHLTAAAPTKVRYGCDQNQLDVVAFTGERSAPGLVWLLPPTTPASWRPRSLAIASPVAATSAHRHDTVGPLSLELQRRDATHGTLTIARDGRVLHTVAIERAEMEGAPTDPLDFRQAGVAIPVPVAAWSLGDAGPILLVLQAATYEGLQQTTILVEADGARELPAMSPYLYRCAF
jgi:hypothetical protein